MPACHIRGVDENLFRQMKASAALHELTLREWCIAVFEYATGNVEEDEVNLRAKWTNAYERIKLEPNPKSHVRSRMDDPARTKLARGSGENPQPDR